jgi:hypothetical protein
MDVAPNTDTTPKTLVTPPKNLIESTWEELGYKVKPLYAKVFVRTDLPPEKIGLIYLPPKLADFHGGYGHQRLVTATVLAAGPLAKMVKPGDRVCFARLYFGYLEKLKDKTFFGWIEQEQLAGHPSDEDIEPLKA